MKKTFTDEFREAVLNAEESRYRISKETGISESILSRFCRGDSGMSNAYMDLIAEYLGLHVSMNQRHKKKASKGRKRPASPKTKDK